ncbi:hypothetical protein Pmani_018533 [Petrolisthes manimaculis]|uniref:Uncharacterized protein n=1 Tax=Petrolisthes manimaculis TaxID=1843537 RepID=A0AAE1U8N8_9EUCA|nr:hypothetical protein Pmani_018533 [Petrolisthes manimaculis]
MDGRKLMKLRTTNKQRDEDEVDGRATQRMGKDQRMESLGLRMEEEEEEEDERNVELGRKDIIRVGNDGGRKGRE